LLNLFAGANGCRTEISENDPAQNDAIQCCHQSDQFTWIDHRDSCSRWLCNNCRIKLSINIDSSWFCCDHEDMHDNGEDDNEDDDGEDEDEDDDDEEENHQN
jgi:hypothetical protein